MKIELGIALLAYNINKLMLYIQEQEKINTRDKICGHFISGIIMEFVSKWTFGTAP